MSRARVRLDLTPREFDLVVDALRNEREKYRENGFVRGAGLEYSEMLDEVLGEPF